MSFLQFVIRIFKCHFELVDLVEKLLIGLNLLNKGLLGVLVDTVHVFVILVLFF